jgi:hypothetical protein
MKILMKYDFIIKWHGQIPRYCFVSNTSFQPLENNNFQLINHKQNKKI